MEEILCRLRDSVTANSNIQRIYIVSNNMSKYGTFTEGEVYSARGIRASSEPGMMGISVVVSIR